MLNAVRGALLPIAKEHYLLLPDTLLAEITDETSNLLVMGAREGIIGKIQWRGFSVPLVAYESAIDFAIPYHGQQAKVAIIFNPEADDDMPFIALSIQGAPAIESINEHSLISIEKPAETTVSLIKHMVEINGKTAFIPDILALMSFVKIRSS